MSTTPETLSEDDLANLYAMYSVQMGGGVAPVAIEAAKRLEVCGLVKLSPAFHDDHVEGEIDAEYTFRLTEEGERAARNYRASWPTFTR